MTMTETPALTIVTDTDLIDIARSLVASGHLEFVKNEWVRETIEQSAADEVAREGLQRAIATAEQVIDRCQRGQLIAEYKDEFVTRAARLTDTAQWKQGAIKNGRLVNAVKQAAKGNIHPGNVREIIDDVVQVEQIIARMQARR